MIGIPIDPKLTYFDEIVSLDGVNYTLSIRWNARDTHFYMDVLDETGMVLLVGGLKIVTNYIIGMKYTGRAYPGAFIALDTSARGGLPGLGDPQLGEFGVRVPLLYITGAELAPFFA